MRESNRLLSPVLCKLWPISTSKRLTAGIKHFFTALPELLDVFARGYNLLFELRYTISIQTNAPRTCSIDCWE